jgi:hypothetical protein
MAKLLLIKAIAMCAVIFALSGTSYAAEPAQDAPRTTPEVVKATETPHILPFPSFFDLVRNYKAVAEKQMAEPSWWGRMKEFGQKNSPHAAATAVTAAAQVAGREKESKPED